MLGQEFLALEPRNAPSAFIGSGVFRFDDGFEIQPFGDWQGSLSTLDNGDEVWVGAGVGGGPRVGVFNSQTHQRTRPDWFAADPSSREGIVLVAPGMPTKPTVDLGPKTAYTIFMEFDGPYSPTYEIQVSEKTASYFSRLPVRFVNTRPAGPPGSYGTTVIGVPTSWEGFASAGYAPNNTFGLDRTSWAPKEVYVSSLGAELTGAAAAHEIGHGLGLNHKGGTIMNKDLSPSLSFDDEQIAFMGTRVS